jgi:hypothetical protein
MRIIFREVTMQSRMIRLSEPAGAAGREPSSKRLNADLHRDLEKLTWSNYYFSYREIKITI